MDASRPPLPSNDDAAPADADWTPLTRHSVNFTTRRLRQVSTTRQAFRPIWGIVVAWVVTIPASALLVLGYLDPDSALGLAVARVTPPALIGMIIGSSTLVFCVLAMWAGMRPIVFDTASGWFWQGWLSPESTRPGLTSSSAVRLSRVRAVQVLSKFVQDKYDGRHYHFYELNLVLHDGRRLHVLGHAGMAALRGDANALAAFIGKPVWEKVNF